MAFNSWRTATFSSRREALSGETMRVFSGRFDVALGDGADALFRVGNFLHTALLLECVERGGNLACGQQFDGRFQSRVLLANDLIQSGRAHSGFL